MNILKKSIFIWNMNMLRKKIVNLGILKSSFIIRFLGFFSLKDMQTPHPPSVLIRFLWMMGSVLYSIGKIMKNFSSLYFSSYRKLVWWCHKNDTKMSISRKIKIGKIRNLVFLPIQPIADLSCKIKKNIYIGFVFL